MTTIHLSSTTSSLFKSNNNLKNLSSSNSISQQLPFHSTKHTSKRVPQITSSNESPTLGNDYYTNSCSLYGTWRTGEGSDERTKTKIVCTIGPSTSSRDMIWKLAETGMNVARLNMSHGDHTSHQKTIDFVKQYNSHFQDRVISIMLDTKVKLLLHCIAKCIRDTKHGLTKSSSW